MKLTNGRRYLTPAEVEKFVAAVDAARGRAEQRRRGQTTPFVQSLARSIMNARKAA